MVPEIYKVEGSNLTDPEEVQHCPRGSQKGHQEFHPDRFRKKELNFCRQYSSLIKQKVETKKIQKVVNTCT